MWDIIPDIHGHADKLTGLLGKLGYAERNGAWRHPDPRRTVVFLGDFIDRGPENARVISIVRAMIEAGTAQAIMGNHELNAIHFHTLNQKSGDPLREHSPKNIEQHASFLAEHPQGSKDAREAVDWMRSLPLFLELDEFRVVHACWSETAVDLVSRSLPDARLTEEAVHFAADRSHPLFSSIETLTKGPEAQPHHGFSFKDKGGHERSEVRLAWWSKGARTWKDIAMSVPDAERQLPDCELPKLINAEIYSEKCEPVFFGHYWLQGDVVLQSHNALCLDYSAGLDGPLLAYTLEDPKADLNLDKITAFSI